ncbi:MAG TPA: glycogen synthase GlgA [Candidatus Pullichristensenella stercoripullorum]|nr:glycogen synthase GlgA [Candidatus Pullichristensenella stercoripullorum]
MKVLFAASECVPFVKTGGLADVVGALPKRLRDLGVDVRVMLPMYSAIEPKWREKMEHVLFFYVNLGWRRQYVGVEKLVYDGITFYFIDNEQYFGRNYIYGYGADEGERFAYFCRAVLESLPLIDFVPDVIHCNDWQTGLIPPMLDIQYRKLEQYKDVKTVFTIHNLKYQGLFQIDDIEEMVSLGELAYTADSLEFYGMCSFIKGGIVFADHITTVSPTYAQEIQTAYYGERLDGLLRARADSLTGILNGIDTVEYDPETDKAIAVNYTADTFEKKAGDKIALQRQLGLQENADAPIIAMVTRLNSQKGLDLVERVLAEIMSTGAQMVVLGMGESKYEDLFNWAQWKYAGQLSATFQMNHELSHRIYAGADMYLMPSMFEPCGLSQLISLRYGTLPIVRETGGLRDTVLSYNEYTGEGNGFSFLNYNAHDMLHVIERAVSIYHEKKDVWNMLARRAMQGSYGWDESAKKYLALYEELTAPKPEKPARKKAAKPAAEGEKKPAARKKTAKAAEEPAQEAEKKPARRRAAKPKAEEAPAQEAEKKPARRTRAKKAEPET